MEEPLLCKQRETLSRGREDGIGFFDATRDRKVGRFYPYGVLFFHRGLRCLGYVVRRCALASRISTVSVHEIPVERYWSGRGKLGNWIRALMKENRSKTGNYLRFGPKVSRK